MFISLGSLQRSMIVWMSGPPNWLLGPRAQAGDTDEGGTEVFPVGSECRKCVQTEMEKERVLKAF